ncbi:hypothetical protein GCM10028799_07130 [Kribbella italica]
MAPVLVEVLIRLLQGRPMDRIGPVTVATGPVAVRDVTPVLAPTARRKTLENKGFRGRILKRSFA